jgi:peptide/nickel transport system substrate-binding protein
MTAMEKVAAWAHHPDRTQLRTRGGTWLRGDRHGGSCGFHILRIAALLMRCAVSRPADPLKCVKASRLRARHQRRLRRAVLMALNQEDYLRAVTGNDPAAFRLSRGFWPTGTPYASEAGAELMTAPRNLEAARAAVRASGYNGERIVIINPTDFPTIGPFGQVTHDLFRRLGLNSELLESDWGTVVQRRNSREGVERGGWSMFHTWWPSVSILNPAINAVIRGAGERAWFGWHSNPRIEELATQWLAAPTPAAQSQIAAAMQASAFETVPAMPLGQFFIHTAYRANLRGVLKGVAPYPWNVRRV